MSSSVEKSIRNRGSNPELFAAMVIFCITIIFLTIFGLIMIFSSSYVEAICQGQNALTYFGKQFVFVLVGVTCAILIIRFCSTIFIQGKVMFICYLLLTLCFAGVLVFGDDILGAKRWFYLGAFSMQPSEFMKIVVVIYTSSLICNFRNENEEALRFFLKLAFFVLLPIAWILVFQKDMGTAIIVGIGCLMCLWLSGVDKRIILGVVIVGLVIGVAVILSSPHRLARVLALIFPDQHANDGGYQLMRSRYAMAGGGVFGLGIGNSHEKFLYLPEAETDFIFAI
ncbi:MAG: FtsW/RodA/SpoVE family cell cycle protein, partial [Eggerthellaceae bacterium]|nr:FtsW/RodA/SpoVE family cell cycle protein [Eggerthellaceae bacterium]